jgi:hypothetical protein
MHFNRERYGNFTVKHFHEHLVRRHGYKLCYTVTRLSLQAGGLVAKAKRRPHSVRQDTFPCILPRNTLCNATQIFEIACVAPRAVPDSSSPIVEPA